MIDTGILLLQLSQSLGSLGLDFAVTLSPAVVSRLRDLNETAELDNDLALGDQLFRCFQLADDLLRCVPGAFSLKSPAQSGGLRTLISPGPVSDVDIKALILL